MTRVRNPQPLGDLCLPGLAIRKQVVLGSFAGVVTILHRRPTGYKIAPHTRAAFSNLPVDFSNWDFPEPARFVGRALVGHKAIR